MGDVAQRNGVWFGDDLLARVTGLAWSRCLEGASQSESLRNAVKSQDRLVIGNSRQLQVGAMAGSLEIGPNPTDRGKLESNHHVLADANRVPGAMLMTGANVHDVSELIPFVDEGPCAHGLVNHPKKRPDAVQADTAYDSKVHPKELWRRGIRTLIPMRHRKHGSRLGKTRWVIERTLAWFHRFRRLQIRWERRPDIHKAFMLLDGGLICFSYYNY